MKIVFVSQRYFMDWRRLLNHPFKSEFGSLLFCFAFVAVSVFSIGPAQGQVRLLNLDIGGRMAEVEIAATEKERDVGLMDRFALPADHGMLFVFPEVHAYCMWMKNTPIPLSVAFIDESGEIVSIEEMQPESEQYYCAAKPVRFALEMASGWFGRNRVGPGLHIKGMENAPRGE